MVTKLDSMAEFEENVIKADGKVLVDFFADWCGPCKMLGPIVEAVSEEKEDVKFFKINIDEVPEAASKYMIMSIPMLIVFENGEIYKKSVGAISKSEMLELF